MVTARSAGWRRTLPVLAKLNQHDGYDCPSCAWPDPEHRSFAEFCENGAKAAADAASTARLTPERLAKHSLDELASRSDQWFNDAGRLTAPAVKPAGRRPLRADLLAAGAGAGGITAVATRRPEPGGVLHVGQGIERGGLPVPAVRAPVRDEQPPGLLQHVPRVVRRGDDADDRRRQGNRHPARPGSGRAGDRRRPESRHQRPEDAHRPATCGGAWRHDRLGQPDARAGAGGRAQPAGLRQAVEVAAGGHRPGSRRPLRARQAGRRPGVPARRAEGVAGDG